MILLLIVVLLPATQVFAQNDSAIPIPAQHTVQKTNADTGKLTDVRDVLQSIFHIKGLIKRNDTVGLKPVVSIVPAFGYTLQSRLAILLSGNVAFRTGPQSNVSTIVSSIAYTQNKQVTLPIQSSIWSKNNNYDFVGEIRLYHYPQATFGLGSNSNIENQAPMNYNYIRFNEVALRRIASSFYMGAGYIIDYHADITIGQTENGTVPDYLGYKRRSTKTHSTSSGLTLNGQYDTRDSPLNATSGWYATYEFRQNLKTMGSTATWSSLILDVRKYLRFPESSKNVIAFWSYNWLTLAGRPPYLDLPSTLWDASTNAGRGYIQGRFRGAQMIYGEAEYRYRITRNGLLGGVIFLNAESFSAEPGTRLQAIQPAVGPGLRIKLNKVSRTNICIDYGFGRQDSHGLFINVGEIF
jgi:hypothetical protein